MFTKNQILSEIRRTAEENGGEPLGIQRFQAETGITRTDWLGKYWARWGDAQKEAGFEANTLQGPRGDEELLGQLAEYVRELGRFPVVSELRLRARTHSGFPWHNTVARLGNKEAQITMLRDYGLKIEASDLVEICESELSRLGAKSSRGSERQQITELSLGFVYLLKSGRYFKIGRSNSIGRRERELAIQLPEASKIVHAFQTDDPVGIEAYWHKRFGDRRKNGEWFELTAQDIAAFRRRKKFM
ncbi:MAG: GIY-YIG nuclease family protein [Acidobacteria bacterium]|nr:GIY-YIG nuclease family protein [Acidobacteriota bacterium]